MDDTVTTEPALEDFAFRAVDKLRYGDTDRQGHVNNAVFATFVETGRVEALRDGGRPLGDEGCSFVLARLVVDYRAEVLWPGEVRIGTRIAAVGRSSITMDAAIFQNDRCVATAQSVVVQTNDVTRRSQPLSEQARGLFLARARRA